MPVDDPSVATATAPSSPAEPMPVPPRPEPPLPTDCCGSGCVRCVNDVYADELAEWERRFGPTAPRS